jgi:hypothetical protein
MLLIQELLARVLKRLETKKIPKKDSLQTTDVFVVLLPGGDKATQHRDIRQANG